jgi:hypothetical protein
MRPRYKEDGSGIYKHYNMSFCEFLTSIIIVLDMHVVKSVHYEVLSRLSLSVTLVYSKIGKRIVLIPKWKFLSFCSEAKISS